MSKGTSKNVEALLALVDAEGDFAYLGHQWLKADQPTIAKKLGCATRTVGNIIKDPAFVTHRTRLGGTNVTLIRRADAKSANRQSKSANPQSKSATKSAAKSAKIEGTFELAARREELRQIWLAHQCKFTSDRVTKSEYGLLLELARLGITPDAFRYVLDNWTEFLSCVNTQCTDPITGKSELTAYRPEPWLGTIVQFAEAAKEVYITHKQWEDGYNQQKKIELDKLADEL